MKRYDRYFFRIALANFCLAAITVASLYVIIDLVVNITNFNDANIKMRDVVAYYMLMLPQILYLLGPFIILLGGMFGIARILKSRELIPLRVAGVRTWRAFLSFWVVALLVSSSMYVIQEEVLPALHRKALSSGLSSVKKGAGQRASVQDRNGNSWFVREYTLVGQAPTLTGTDIILLDSAGIATGRVRAESLVYNGSEWEGVHHVLPMGVDEPAREYRRDGPVEKVLLLPGDIVRSTTKGVRSLTELFRQVDAEPHRFDIKLLLFRSLTYPLYGVLLLMVGAVIAVRARVKNPMVALALALGFSFVVFSVMFVLEGMAQNMIFSPEVAGFSPVIVLCVVAAASLRWLAD